MESVLFDAKKDKKKYILYGFEAVLLQGRTWLFVALFMVLFPIVIMSISNLNFTASLIVGIFLAFAVPAWLIYRRATLFYRNGTYTDQVGTGEITNEGVFLHKSTGIVHHLFSDFKLIKDYCNFYHMVLKSGQGFVISKRALTTADLITLKNAKKEI